MNDFDFLLGEWEIANRRRRRLLEGCDDWDEFGGTSSCRPYLGGLANVDSIDFPTLGTHGMTVRLLDVVANTWSLYWANSRDGILQPPVVGRFSHGTGYFYGDDHYLDRPIRVRYIWSGITPDSARWEQAFSVDNERTWETNWIMEFSRLPTSGSS